jgi:putative DNA-invertase from lambdoid prophage Rac
MIDLGGDVTGNGISKLVFTILSAVAEAERDRIRERIRDVKTDQRSRSRYLGGKVPLGWIVDSQGVLANDKQQQAILRMRELRGAGHSLRSIAATLAKEQFGLSHAGGKKILLANGGCGGSVR